MRAARTVAGLVSFVSLLTACSSFEPNVGPLQGDGAAASTSTCALGASGYGSSYGSPSGQSAANDFCAADGGTIQGPCDVCEATSCCAQRVACYSEQTCSCADTLLDTCLSSVSVGDAGADAAASAAPCWSTFSKSDAVAAARYQCLVASCKAACQIP